MGALVDDFAAAKDDHAVGPADLRQAMGDQQGRATFEDATDRLLDLGLGFAVDGAGRVVDDQDAGIGQEGAGDRDALTLSAGERDTTFADRRFVAVGELRG